MAKKIEILENTLLKLLIRRGTDLDRQNIILSEGELGYTTDTKNLYIGDGQAKGGILIRGNIFMGSVNDLTLLVSATPGDFAFNPDTNSLYRFKGSPNILANWEKIGGVYTAGNGTIAITNDNRVVVGLLSAGNFSTNVAGQNITIDSNGKIAGRTDVTLNSITAANESLSLPGKITINEIVYNLPVGGIGNNTYLSSDILGNLSWRQVIATPVYVTNPTGIIPVGSIMPFVSAAAAPTGWLLCNGQLVNGAQFPVLSALIGTTYGGDNINFRLPDLTNKIIYGSTTASDPVYNIDTTSSFNILSGAPGLYIIKAVPDTIINTTLTVTSPLTASVDNIDVTDDTISLLAGEVKIGVDQRKLSNGGSSYKNKLVNGRFNIWQRGTITSSIPVSANQITILADCWYTSFETNVSQSQIKGRYSVIRRTSENIERAYFDSGYYYRVETKNSIGVNTSTPVYNSLSAESGSIAKQYVENFMEVAGKPVVLSFWARASNNTKIVFRSQVTENTATSARDLATPSINRIFNIGTTWQKYTYSFNMPTLMQVLCAQYDISTISKTPVPSIPAVNPLSLNSINSENLIYSIDFKTHLSLGDNILHGSVWDGETSLRRGANVNYPGEPLTPADVRDVSISMLSANGWYDIADIQLEVGYSNTDIEKTPLENEHERCLRYFEKNWDLEEAVGTAGYSIGKTAGFISYIPAEIRFNKIKCRTPIVSVYSTQTGTKGMIRRGSSNSDLVVDVSNADKKSFIINSNTSYLDSFGIKWAADSPLRQTSKKALIFDKNVKVNIFLDDSGSMDGTLKYLRDYIVPTYLRNALLPYYDNNITLYNSKVNSFLMGSEDFLKKSITDSNISEPIINIIFINEAEPIYYPNSAPYTPTSTWISDITNVRDIMINTKSNIYSTVIAIQGFNVFQSWMVTAAGVQAASTNYPIYYPYTFADLQGRLDLRANIKAYTGGNSVVDQKFYTNLIIASINRYGYDIPTV